MPDINSLSSGDISVEIAKPVKKAMDTIASSGMNVVESTKLVEIFDSSLNYLENFTESKIDSLSEGLKEKLSTGINNSFLPKGLKTELLSTQGKLVDGITRVASGLIHKIGSSVQEVAHTMFSEVLKAVKSTISNFCEWLSGSKTKDKALKDIGHSWKQAGIEIVKSAKEQLARNEATEIGKSLKQHKAKETHGTTVPNVKKAKKGMAIA